ncbi:MAG: acylphosphatase [Desulfopila sp.]
MKKTVHVIVEGRVQGVGFRFSTQQQARQLQLRGWVRNRPEGTVEAIISGNAEDVDRMLAWLHTGSPLAEVLAVHVKEVPTAEASLHFAIRH